MAIRIDKPIVDYRVRKNDPPQETAQATGESAQAAEKGQAEPGREVISMDETLERPYELKGTTYKVKTPVSDHAMYITINDIVLNEGTESEVRRPFEIFINSKNLDHFQWIVALTRIISAVFRKGGDVAFLVEELKAVFDPRGGYWKTGGKYMPSLIAEIGEVIERHLTSIGMIQPKGGLTDEQRKILNEKRTEYESRSSGNYNATTNGHAAGLEDEKGYQNQGDSSAFPAGATLCPKCNTAAVVVLDGCRTCLNCGDSKCN